MSAKQSMRIIEIEAYADGILVGGMSYPLEDKTQKAKGKPGARSMRSSASRTVATKARQRRTRR